MNNAGIIDAMTFNAAGVSPLTIAWWDRKNAKIDAYVHVRDELHKIQKKIGLIADGHIHWRYKNRMVLGHSIENFYRSDNKLIRDRIREMSSTYQDMYNNSNFRPF